MKCPFCEKEMIKGTMMGDGRTKIRWEPEGEKIGLIEQLVGIGRIDAEYSFTKFKIHADYCEHCKKMIFTTNIYN